MDDGYEEDFEFAGGPEFIDSGEDRCWCCGVANPGGTYCDICWLLHPATSDEARESFLGLVIKQIFHEHDLREGSDRW